VEKAKTEPRSGFGDPVPTEKFLRALHQEKPRRRAGALVTAICAEGRLQLAVLPQYFAAGAADAPALRSERCATLDQIAPGHAGRAVTQPRCGRLAWRKFGHINGAGACAQSAENETRSKHHFHSEKFPSFVWKKGRC
jgi:hypothetical protein